MTSCGGAGSSSATFQIWPSRPRVRTSRVTSAMSSTWARLTTWPGLTIRRASPCAEPRQRVAARPVDAGQAQDVDRDPAAPCPLRSSALRPEAAPAPAPSGSASRSSRRPRPRHARRRRRWSNNRRCGGAPGRPRSPSRSGRAAPARPARRNRDDDRLGPVKRLPEPGAGAARRRTRSASTPGRGAAATRSSERAVPLGSIEAIRRISASAQ